MKHDISIEELNSMVKESEDNFFETQRNILNFIGLFSM